MENYSQKMLNDFFNGPNIIVVMVAAFMITFVFLIIKAAKIKRKIDRQDLTEHPKGHYINRGIVTLMPLGFAVSIPLGIAVKNLAVAAVLGPIIGLLLGIIAGYKKEKKHLDELRSLSPEESKLKKLSQKLLTALFILGILLYLITYVILP